jgi:hypothetical protein
MKLIGLLLVRNEDWVLGVSLRALLLWCDAVVVLLHACSDLSSDIVEQVIRENDKGRVIMLREFNQDWHEMRDRQQVLEWARGAGATHLALVDADEILTGNLLPNIRDMVEQIPPRSILQLPWVCLARGIDRYYAAGYWYNSWISCGCADASELHWSSEERDGYDFHHREPMGAKFTAYRPVQQSPHPAHHGGGLLHLQFVSERRLRAKQALYKIVEVTRWPGRDTVAVINKRYDLAVYQSDPANIQTVTVPEEWWAPYAHLMKHLDLAAVPWQEESCRRMITQHGRATFQGLDLFGVV